MTGTQAPDLPTTAGPAVTDPALVPLPAGRARVPDQVRGKLYIKTHGCQMNEYDSAKMADVLAAEHGLELTDDEAEADVILVNTCSIRERAEDKMFSLIGKWKHLKRDKPVLISVTMNNSGGIFQVEEILAPKVIRTVGALALSSEAADDDWNEF